MKNSLRGGYCGVNKGDLWVVGGSLNSGAIEVAYNPFLAHYKRAKFSTRSRHDVTLSREAIGTDR